MIDDAAWRHRRFHFIGIGGLGMSALALACVQAGATVTGSDLRPSPAIDRLAGSGIAISIGHSPANVVEDVDVVFSSAVKADNVERQRAAQLGLRQVRRGDLLGELTTLKRCVAVAGTHGKTTTAAMIVHALREAGRAPSHVIGGELRDGTPNASWRSGEWLVVETDESDRSFLSVNPEIAVVTNVELDHLNEYSTQAEVEGAFRSFVAGATQVVLSPLRVDAMLSPQGSRFSWRSYEVDLHVPGSHNVLNACTALEACCLAGADPGALASALANFPGVRRRIERLGTTENSGRVYLDCANHPTAVRASLAALRTVEPGRIFVVFEPLLYTRTLSMAAAVGEALAAADVVVVLELLAGSEAFVDHPDVSGELVVTAARAHMGSRPVVWADTADRALDYLRTEMVAGDTCVVMGIGPAALKVAGHLADRT